MVSKKQLKELIKTISSRTGKKQEEISVEAGYKAKTLTQLLSKGEGLDSAYNTLKLVYKNELNNSTRENTPYQPNLDTILQVLSRIENGQSYIRAEIRGYGQYQIQKDLDWDQEKFLVAMGKVGRLIGANLKADDQLGNKARDGK